MTTDEARVEATRRTYARRAARRAADELAGVSIDLWDDATKRIVAALAAHLPSNVTAEELDDAFGPIGPRLFSWDELPHGTEDIHVAFGAELERMGLTADEVDDERERDEAAAAADDAELDDLYDMCQPIGCDAGIHLPGCKYIAIDADLDARHGLRVHDNGDYRA